MRSFFAGIITIVVSLNLAVWWGFDAILRRAGEPEIARVALAGFVLIQFAGVASLFISRLVFDREPGTGADRPLHILTMLWNPLLALPAAVIASGWIAIATLTGATGATMPGIVLAGVAAFPAMAIGAAVFSFFQLDRFVITRRILEVPGLPAELKGLTLAHVSDLHVGGLTRGKILRRVTATTNALNPDLIVLTGDIINMSLDALPEALATLRGMRARLGIFGVEGNHDLMDDAAEFERRIKASGLNFLMNERAAVAVNGRTLAIIGLRWGEGHGRTRASSDVRSAIGFTRLLAAGAPEDFTIVLAHHPDAFDATAAAGVPLTFAGHTHGGQLMLAKNFGFGPWLYRYWSGIYSSGDSRLVVSNGAGNWFPLRLGAPAEIIHLTLN